MKNKTSASVRDENRRNAKTRRMRSALSLLLAAVLLFSVCGLPVTAANRKPGDVDGDGEITSADARLALRRSVGLETYKENSPEYAACDVDFDGSVSSADARLILRGSVRLEDTTKWKKPTAAAVPKKLVAKETVAFTMQIPEGWELRFGWDGEKMLLIRVYDPKQPVNQIFYATDIVPFMKSEAAAQWYGRTVTKMFSEAPVLDPPTNETLFKQIPKLRTYYLETVKSEATAAMIPEIYDFRLIQTLPSKTTSKEYAGLDESILYGSFRNENGSAKGEGIGYASILDHFGASLTDPITGIDPAYYFVYNLTAITSAAGTFADYQEILCRSFSTLKLKDDFVKKMLKNSDAFFTQGKAVNDSINGVYEKINAAWDARIKGDDLKN